MNWNVKIIVKHNTIKTLILIDFDVSIRIYVNRKYVKQHKLFTIEFTKFIKLKFVNEFFVKNITHVAKIELLFNDHHEQLWIFVIDCENFDIIFEQSWLSNHNSHIDWKNRIMTFNFKHCCVNCNSFFEIITIINRNFKFKNKHRKNKFSKKKQCICDKFDITHFSIYIFIKMIHKKKRNNCYMIRTFRNFKQIWNEKQIFFNEHFHY